MTRDALTLTKGTIDNTKSISIAEITKVAITQANGIVLNDAFGGKENSIWIAIENTAVAAKTATIKAGNGYPNNLLGDCTFALKASSTTLIQLKDGARFLNKDGSVNIDFSTGTTGYIYAVADRAGILPPA